MEQPKAVEVLEVCIVAPPLETTTTGTPTSLPLTFFDLLWLRFPPVERLFFYNFPHPTTFFFDSVLPKLKHSLSHTLQHFLPLAGKLIWPPDSPKPLINFVPGRDAVTLIIAKSDSDFNLFFNSNLCEAVKSHHLVPHLTTSHEQASILSIQITLFPNSGFSVGIATHHAVVDGKSSISFLKSWAYICSNVSESSNQSCIPDQLVPFYDRSVIKDPKGIDSIYVSDWMKYGEPNSRSLMVWKLDNNVPDEAIRGTFELTPADLQKLKQNLETKLINAKARILSNFALTCAYTWTCLVRAEETKVERSLFFFNVDCRGRLDPPISSTYFGNCIVWKMASAETKSILGEDGLVNATEAMVEALGRLENGILLDGAETWVSVLHGRMEGCRWITSAWSNRFDVYGVDFGWGRPRKVEMTSIDKTGAFCLSESKRGNGGVEVSLVLNKPVMEAFASLFVKGLENL